MNLQVNPADMALNMYETACVSHRRQDWREASHALAKALRTALASSVAHAPLAIAAPVQTPATVARVAKGKPAKAVKASGYVMTAESLAKALRLAGRVVQARSEIPIIQHVQLTGLGDILEICTTDLDREICVTVEAPGVGGWTAVVPHKALLAMMAGAKGAVSFLGEDNGTERRGAEIFKLSKLTISGAVSAVIPGRCVDDFPVMAIKAAPVEVGVSSANLANLLAFTAPAMSTEETRYYLNGVYIHTSKDTDDGGAYKLRAAATDGHRLHLAKLAYDGQDFPGVIIPRPTALDMAVMLKGGEAASLQVFGETHCRLTVGAVTLTSKLIDGSFPDYRRVIPRDNAATLTIDGGELAAAVKQVMAVSDSKTRPVRMVTAPDGLAISCKGLDGAESAATVKAIYCGALVKMGFAARYVLDAVSVMGDALLTVALYNPAAADEGETVEPFDHDLRPVLITATDQPDRLCVLMPLRV